jgi:hypothetical protein
VLAPEPRATADAEPPLQSFVLLTVFDRRPYEQAQHHEDGHDCDDREDYLRTHIHSVSLPVCRISTPVETTNFGRLFILSVISVSLP